MFERRKLATYIAVLALFLLKPESVNAVSYQLVHDSTYSYYYDNQSAEWILSGSYHYYSSNGLPDSTVTHDSNGQPIARAVYTYENGILKAVLSQNAVAGIWVNSQYQEFIFNGGRLSERIVTKWQSGAWINLNRFTYFYDPDDNLIVYQRDVWRQNAWSVFSADSLFYDSQQRLILRSARLRSGEFVTRQIYDYDDSGLRISQIRQDFINEAWVNVSRVNNLYNCDLRTGSITESWTGGAWQPVGKSRELYHVVLDPTIRKMPMCYEGNTIFISPSELNTYLELGACVDGCPPPTLKSETLPVSPQSSIPDIPFVVYPNPASENINIRFNSLDMQVDRVELFDFNGRMIYSVSPEDQSAISIETGNLKSGNYILRVISDTVYSMIITRK